MNIEELQEVIFNQKQFPKILRILGYGLLLLALLDIIEMFIPPNFMNPAWEFQTFGGLIERVAVPLIGLVFVFYGERDLRRKWELLFVKILSWLTLVIAISFLLLIPLLVSNTIRINKQNSVQISNAVQQQILQAEQVQKQLNAATPEQINNLLKKQGRSIEGKKPEEIKNQILSEISQAKTQIETQSQNTRSSQKLNLIKSSVKWNLGALISGALFFSLWKATKWARIN
ncbi:HpsJ family protein [Nostoc sp. UHCC 0702]|nr:HpsJ family protein [Nostoc sp. UHCC 0702]